MINSSEHTDYLEYFKELYPKKFASETTVFRKIQRGAKLFIGTGCAEPEYLMRSFVKYVEDHPNAFYDAEIYHSWALGTAPYTDERFKHNFRHTSFFISDHSRAAVNLGLADYSPIFLSQLPDLFYRDIIHIDVAFVQASPLDKHGYMSLGISVDSTKAAVDNAVLVVVQVNANMPRIHGDGFIHIDNVDYIIPFDEPLIEYERRISTDITKKIGKYVSRIIEDGDTLQIGYGTTPNAILPYLHDKKHLGIHTELLTDGIVGLMEAGVIDNSKKTKNRGKTIASFCMGKKKTYDCIHDNPAIEFRTIDYTNNRLIIAGQNNMVAINSALQIDLTGQATSESVGKLFYSSVGGHADFMRGAVLAQGGKAILTCQSTANDGKESRIVPMLDEGTGITLTRGDIHYVVTEYGIAYLHGKTIRERAMDLIAIAHPKFKPWLIDSAKELGLIFRDQAFIPGKRGEYPENLEIYRSSSSGLRLLLRPVKISDEPLLKEFFYSLSDESMRRRFISYRKDMPHEVLQDFVIIDYTKEIIILAIIVIDKIEKIVGLGQYSIDELSHTAEAAFVVRDNYQSKGIGRELLSYLTRLAKRQGLLGFTAEVLTENRPMLKLFESMGFDVHKRIEEGCIELKMDFNDRL